MLSSAALLSLTPASLRQEESVPSSSRCAGLCFNFYFHFIVSSHGTGFIVPGKGLFLVTVMFSRCKSVSDKVRALLFEIIVMLTLGV